MPPRKRTGPPRPGDARFRPRDPKRAKYYKASLVAAGVFLALAMVFPFWLDHVKRSRDQADFEAATAVNLVPDRTAPVPSTVQAARAPGGLPYSNRFNAECQAYVNARCNVLGIRPGVCGSIEAVGMKVPLEEGPAGCRKAVEALITEAASIASPPTVTSPASVAAEESEGDGLPPTVTGTPPMGPGMAGTGDAEGKEPAEEPTGEEAGELAGTARDEKKELTPKEKADNLSRVHILVEELQRAAQNYSTLPAAQQARFVELHNRVEADGGPELRQLYNTLLKQHGRSAWYGSGPASRKAQESGRVEAGVQEGPSPTTTPEMDRVRGMMNDARREAGMAPQAPPSLGPSSPPTTVDPSTVQAAPAQSL